jgi:hypothetical protein
MSRFIRKRAEQEGEEEIGGRVDRGGRDIYI